MITTEYNKNNTANTGLKQIIFTNTLLEANSSETSDFVDIQEYSRVVGTAYSDVDGTLTLEFSQDKVNVDYISEFQIAGNDKTTTAFDQLVIAKYVRAKFSTVSPQTVFRLTVNGREVS